MDDIAGDYDIQKCAKQLMQRYESLVGIEKE